jgi:glycosyltransferase involved in cell wall biosynthesis
MIEHMTQPSASTSSASESIGQDPSVSVVVPTYKEAANLPLLIPQVSEALAKAGLSHEILIVDDNSRDGSVEKVQELIDMPRPFPVKVMVRTTERGLATAVLHGFRHARGQVLVCMDADLSHPPERVPALAQPLLDGQADFSIGSRYVTGGSVDEGWSAYRWLNSKFATLLARPLTRVGDPMAGFFAIRRETYERSEPLDPIGYKIALELLVKSPIAAITEVPIHFAQRKHGESKLSLKEQLNYMRHIGRLLQYRLKKGGWKRPAVRILDR